MHARTIAVSATILAIGALSVPVAAQADSRSSAATSSTVVEEHGVLLPGNGAITPRYTQTPEGGGTWTYGTDGANNTAYSNFYHATRKHGSSVENGRGEVDRSVDKQPKEWAKASIRKTFAGNNA